MPGDFFRKPLKIRILRGFLLAGVLALIAIFTPTPYHLHAPGRAEEVGPMIELKTETHPAKGKFILPTVVSERATLLLVIYSLIEPSAILTKEPEDGQMAQSTPPGDRQMGLSQRFASIVALEKLGYDVRGPASGLRVTGVAQDSPNQGTVRRGDLFLELDGQEAKTFKAFRAILDKWPAGTKLTAGIKRQGSPLEIPVELYKPGPQTLLGIFLRSEYETKLPFPIEFRSGNTSGASGGLVFALEIYNRLTPNDITAGHIIAATGTLEIDGEVGPIEGIELKIIGAQRAGADIILIPQESFPTVEDLQLEGLKVVPVSSFNQALDVLENL